jgi:thioredoxin-like negative regulator of GroEL
VLLSNQQRFTEAIPLLREALRIRRSALGAEARDVAEAQATLAGALRRSGALREAEVLAREALATNLKLLGGNSEEVASGRKDLGSLLCSSRPTAAALELLKDAADYYDRHPQANARDAAVTRGDYGECLLKARRLQEAEAQLTSAHEHLVQLGPGHRLAKQSAKRLADLYSAWNRPGDAARFIRR